MLLFSLV
jgi:hypothetical protein